MLAENPGMRIEIERIVQKRKALSGFFTLPLLENLFVVIFNCSSMVSGISNAIICPRFNPHFYNAIFYSDAFFSNKCWVFIAHLS